MIANRPICYALVLAVVGAGVQICIAQPPNPCPQPLLTAPPAGCRYEETEGPDGCPRFNIICDEPPPPCAMPMLIPPNPGCHYDETEGPDGCPIFNLICDELPTPCAMPFLVKPDPGCRYVETMGADGCPVFDLVCTPCMLPSMPAPPEGCRYNESPGPDGCPKFNLVCPRNCASGKTCERCHRCTPTNECVFDPKQPFCCLVPLPGMPPPNCRWVKTPGLPDQCPPRPHLVCEEPQCKTDGDCKPCDKCKGGKCVRDASLVPQCCPQVRPRPPPEGCTYIVPPSLPGQCPPMPVLDCPEPTCETAADCPNPCHRCEKNKCLFSSSLVPRCCPQYRMSPPRPGCEYIFPPGLPGQCPSEPVLKCKEKDGECPIVLPGTIGICVKGCGDDRDCKGIQKCCGNGCSTTCQEPLIIDPLPTCAHIKCKNEDHCVMENGVGQCLPKPPVGQCLVQSDCKRGYRCDIGAILCVIGPCFQQCVRIPPKKGSCPRVIPGIGAICVSTCRDDVDCKGAQKCCSNGCARSCQDPVIEICSLPKVVGDCTALIRSWFYNAKLNKCQRFNYGGCGGNANRFKTKRDCVEACKEASPCAAMTCSKGSMCKIVDTEPYCVKAAKCALPKREGSGDKMNNVFFYNVHMGACEPFVYKGQKGNGNRFRNIKSCERTCAEKTPIALPLLPNDEE